MPRPLTALSVWLEEVPAHENDEHPAVAICYTNGRDTYSTTIADRSVAAIATALAPILLSALYSAPRHVRPVRKAARQPRLTEDEINDLLRSLE